MSRRPAPSWYACYAEDLLSATRGLKPMVRLLYMEVLNLIYRYDGNLPNDDRLIASALCTDIRQVRANKRILIEMRKLYVGADGTLRNRRCDVELAKRRKITAAPVADQSESTPGALSEHSEIAAKNPEKSKPDDTHYTTLQDRKKSEEKNHQPASSESVAPSEGLAGSLSDRMIAAVERWGGMTTLNARQWLRSTVELFGQAATAEAFHKLETDMSTGMIVSRPINAWTSIARRLKAEGAPKAAGAPLYDEDAVARKLAEMKAHSARLRAESVARQNGSAGASC